MTTEEFSNEFDVLLNSYAVINNFGATETPIELDEYEKSVLLTEAQEAVVRGLYNGSLNGDSLEKTEEMRRALDSLIKTNSPDRVYIQVNNDPRIEKDSTLYRLPKDLWFITYETVKLTEGNYCEGSSTIQVIPVKQDEWHRSKNNPFKRPNKRKAVRLDAGNNMVEIVSEYPISNYTIRYIKKPQPIILVPLESPLKINEIGSVTECELNPVLHRVILEAAVQLAMRRLPSASK